jgi:hypothetical protein
MSTENGGPRLSYGGSVIKTAPKHRVSPPKSVKLRVLEDIIPLETTERSMTKHEMQRATGCQSQGPGFTGYSKAHRVELPPGAHSIRRASTYVQYRQGPAPAPKARSERKISPKAPRKSTTAEVRAYLTSIGYTGPLTPQIRKLTGDALTFAAQVAEMSTA